MAHPIRKYRVQQGMTQQELADRLGVSRALVGLVETGERQINPHDVAKWEKVTGVPREKLLPEVFRSAA
jgi:transcriptional regulator with XRE-family HTH domain